MRVKIEYGVLPHPDANMITEAFGIDAGYSQKICDMEIPDDYDILYITGESGSGKSSILNTISTPSKTVDIPTAPLFKWCGESVESQQKAVEILSYVGLSDATMFVNFYCNLSDSQKARARIALMIINGDNPVVVDEFLSTLDRNTARSVAFCVQKVLRKFGIRAIFASAHEDIIPFLKPSHVVKGRSYPSRFVLEKYNTKQDNIILDGVRLFYGDKHLYKKLYLGDIHYKGKYTGGTKEFLFADFQGEIIGCLVSIYRMSDGGRRIARLIVHPSYRGIGVGRLMVQRYLQDYKNVDVVASMARFNPVFERAGMLRVPDSKVHSPSGLKTELQKMGFDTQSWFSKTYCDEFMDKPEHRELLSKFAKYATNLVQPGGAHLTLEEVSAKIVQDSTTAGRVLYGLRDRTLAKYVSGGRK
jgi:ABC-type lipoprotein export system ATPase subunit/GNAT superfamily N-acetyltransferase